MNKTDQLSVFYVKYKTYILPSVLFLLTIFIIFEVIFPQISTVFSLRTDIANKTKEASTLQISLDNLASQDTNQLAADFKTANNALPTAKDVGGMFSALNIAAGRSNVTIRGFSLKVGKLFGEQVPLQTGEVGIPFLTVSTKVLATNGRDYVSFLSEIQKTLPISEVKNITSDTSGANLDINFYYKPLDIAVFAKQEQVSPLTKSEQNLLNQLKEWEQ